MQNIILLSSSPNHGTANLRFFPYISPFLRYSNEIRRLFSPTIRIFQILLRKPGANIK